MLKLISFNVNGLRAILKKDFLRDFQSLDADIFAIQETKLQANQLPEDLIPNYHAYWFYSTVKKGYSGTAVFSKTEPLSIKYGIDDLAIDGEGRVLTLEYPTFYFVTAYVPNAQAGLKRIDFRLEFEAKFRQYLHTLDAKKPVLACGDLNVAHNEIDLANPEDNHENPGFSDAERGAFDELLQSGFIDTFRYFYPDLQDAYSWWSYRTRARERNVGWRIDYFLASKRIDTALQSATIHNEIMGSDHCPVELVLDEMKLS
ncbi:exodeoxyribonuclease III [Amygdalobacter nucleatus]|uniref:Exodeoxyribonuclease III n=1 Tax=Amygdalobacter nucleatus TaxID=3029274 RepID=A0A133Y6S0_9FIRM|nr:exodeoxyribonuclease III [Amygdalobacter nucleatus]KXB38891.1 exodeoxyribonuclease III [Amygdalobacter nucleatus]MDF0485250.1 exodeoxyribonuclease III [Amygdalobacter nucleatus]WEG36880.1 exodeoxyribonuclease III [Amygdalobacter nucleatus]